jgi:hypothetical protein
MMSTALLMTVGGERPKMHSTTTDRIESGEITFAQSFGERVDLAVGMQTMKSTGEASTEIPGGKSSEAQKSDAARMAMTVARGTGNSLPVEMDLVARANAFDRGQSKTAPGQMPTDRDELQQNVEAEVSAEAGYSQMKTAGATAAAANEKLLSDNVEEADAVALIVSNDVLTAESTTIDSVLRESAAVADRWSLSRDAVELPVASEIVLAGKTMDATAAKKTARAHESAIGARPTSKTTETIKSEKVVGDCSSMARVQSVDTLSTQVFTPDDVKPNVVGAATANTCGSFGSTSGKLVAGAWMRSSDDTGRKMIARAGTDDGEATDQGVNPSAGTTVATEFRSEIAKTVTVASTGKDVDEKGPGAVGAAGLVRAVVGSEAAGAGVVPGLASGHTLAEVSETKTQAGEAGTLAATVRIELREQDGFGGEVVEMGMSHRTLLATPTALEVGWANGAQGWLKIRAETTDGGIVTASLSSVTPAGQEMLHRELPALTAYLQEERVAVNTVVVPANASARAESRFTDGLNGDGGGQAQQGSRQGGGDGLQGPIHGTSDRVDEISTHVGLNGVGEDGLLSAGTYAIGGSRLNVRA